MSNQDIFVRSSQNEFEAVVKLDGDLRDFGDVEIEEKGEKIFEDFIVKDSLLLKKYLISIISEDNTDSILIKERKSGIEKEISFERRTRLEFGINPFHESEVLTVIQKFINKPRIYSKINLKNSKIEEIFQEGNMNLRKRSKIVTEKFDSEVNQFSIDFLFDENSITPSSPLILWLSDRKDFDSFNASLVPMLNREFIICFVSVKEKKILNIKTLLQELKSLSFEFALNHNKEKIGIIGEGPISGLLALSTFIKNQAVFDTGVFVSPITDLLDFIRDNSEKNFGVENFGYGDLNKEEIYDEILRDSPYNADEVKYMKNCLFLGHNHNIGYHGLKMFAKGHQLFGRNSNNFWKYTKGNPADDQIMWLTFLVKHFYHSNRKRKFEKLYNVVEDESEAVLPS